MREWDELRDSVAYRASAVAANARRAVASVPHARVAESDPSAAVDGWGVEFSSRAGGEKT